MLDMLASARGIMANAPGEKRLIDRLLCEHTGGRHSPGTPQTVIVGAGFDDVPIPKPESVERFCAARGLTLGYLLYAGRREEAKGLPELFDCYRRFRDHYPDGPPLVLMGSGDLPIPPDLQPHAVDLGFVDLRDRELVYAGASVLLQPSRLESFGMVLFESWLAGTPVLVNGAGEVLRDHVEQSAGGLTYLGEGEFTQALAMLVDDPGLREQMAAAGRGYTLQEFGWDPVIQRFEDALARWS
jgi:glycosyltransferase involved in cell wall biosynthesis